MRWVQLFFIINIILNVYLYQHWFFLWLRELTWFDSECTSLNLPSVRRNSDFGKWLQLVFIMWISQSHAAGGATLVGWLRFNMPVSQSQTAGGITSTGPKVVTTSSFLFCWQKKYVYLYFHIGLFFKKVD